MRRPGGTRCPVSAPPRTDIEGTEQLPRVIAVVPAFNPDENVLERLAVLARQVERVIVVDDGSSAHADPVLTRIEEAGFHVVRTGSNRGIAAALNTGARLALDDGAEHVLTLDQDSEIEPGFVDACLKAFAMAAPATKLGLVCVDRINGAPSLPPRESPEGLGLVGEAIQSGFVISSACLNDCGLFDERLFIDCVDTEFCLRIGDRGYRIAIAKGTNLHHALGERVPLRPFGLRLTHNGREAHYEYHGPYRRYFITRNNVDLWLRFARHRPRWVLSAMRRERGPAITTIVGGPRRRLQFVATAMGFTHGLARRRGPMPAWLKRMILGPR